MLRTFFGLGLLAGLTLVGAVAEGADAPKARVLMLTQSKGFTHGSVRRPDKEKLSASEVAMIQLGQQSGLFDVTCTQDAEADFTIRNMSAVADVQAQTTRVMSIMLGAVASVSLVVGGIGIMNIMLVSVTERTREIGIRMAIGARRRDILLQFLLESTIVSVVGCLIGVALGVGSAALVSGTTGMMVVVTGASILLAFLVAAAVGVFFGFYPAQKAAGLKPIEALRYQ